MFEFLLRTRPIRSSRKRNSARFAPEMLETRDCPTGGITVEAVVLQNHMVQLTGHVTGDYAAGATVSFSGAVANTVTANSNGDYSFFTSSCSLGDVYAVGLFEGNPFTDTASDRIEVAAPVVNLGITDMTDTTVTFSGTLTGIDFAGQTMTISGVALDPVTTNAQGQFQFTANRSGLGTIEVSEEDLWGQTSNLVQIDGANLPPFIRQFTAQAITATGFTFRGRVVGNNVEGLIITFGGIAAIAGQTATVGADGWFELSFEFVAGTFGDVTVRTTQGSANSNVASAYVSAE